MAPKPYRVFGGTQVGAKHSDTVGGVMAAGVVMFLVGFALLIPRGGAVGAVAHRNVTLGHAQLFQTRGYHGVPSRRAKVIRISLALALVAGGVVMMIVGS
jgi:hypothetical protein